MSLKILIFELSGTGGKFVVTDKKSRAETKLHCIYIQSKAES